MTARVVVRRIEDGLHGQDEYRKGTNVTDLVKIVARFDAGRYCVDIVVPEVLSSRSRVKKQNSTWGSKMDLSKQRILVVEDAQRDLV